VRMKLFDFLDLDPGITVTEYEPAGRFIPLTQIRNDHELNRFIVDMVPLLHADPSEAGPIKFVVSELVRNVLEHANSPVGALVCAQYYQKTGRLSVGVADYGMGIRDSISRSHPVKDSLDAIHLALRPGITGTTPKYGGDEYNAGAGLFLLKSIARASRNFFLAYSGDALFKLLKGNGGDGQLLADPRMDRATRLRGVSPWPGTIMGIDISVEAHATFKELLEQIWNVYRLDVRLKKKARYKKPRFVK
jgi:anti-sigma regulatory factor (Ser/Thr protein kinase)